jgi:hypothetical protein
MTRKKRCAIRIKNKCIVKRFTPEEKESVRYAVKTYGSKFYTKAGAEPERFLITAELYYANAKDDGSEQERQWLLYQKMLGKQLTDTETRILSKMTVKELNELIKYLRPPEKNKKPMLSYHASYVQDVEYDEDGKAIE